MSEKQGCWCGGHDTPACCPKNCRWDHRFPALGHSPWCGFSKNRAKKPLTSKEPPTTEEKSLALALVKFLTGD